MTDEQTTNTTPLTIVGVLRHEQMDVKFGDADSPVCWYRPDGSDTYRVIYGDLTVKDVAVENLPK